jgi:hypothetical protein
LGWRIRGLTRTYETLKISLKGLKY